MINYVTRDTKIGFSCSEPKFLSIKYQICSTSLKTKIVDRTNKQTKKRRL